MEIAPWAGYRQISAEYYGTIGEQIAGREDIRGNGAVNYVLIHFRSKLLRQFAANRYS